MNSKIIPFLHKIISDVEFVRRLPSEFGRQPVTCSPRVNLRYLYADYASVDSELLTVASHYVKPGQKVWDIGANIGVFAFASAYRVGPQGEVLAVDADDRHTQLLRKSSRGILPASGPVHVLNAAISNQVAIAQLNVVETGHTKNYLAETQGCGKTGKTLYRKDVVSVTLDWLLSYFAAPDFIKIDVEGAELMVLQGATEILEKIRPVIYLETQEYNQAEVTELLKYWDYELYASEGSKPVKIEQCDFNSLAVPLGEKNEIVR